MKVAYIARTNIPSESAHSVHIMKLCSEINKQVDEFALVIPKQKAAEIGADAFNYYGVDKFDISFSKVDISKKRKGWRFALDTMRTADKKLGTKKYAVITRDVFVAFLSVLSGKETVLDLHGDVRQITGRWYRLMKFKPFVNNKKLHMVMITKSLKEYYKQEYNLDRIDVDVLPDAYDETAFNNVPFRPCFSNGSFNIGYIGKMIVGKGIGLIAELAAIDQQNTYHMYGGNKEEVENRTGIKFTDNVIFHGYVPSAEVPEILQQMDIMLLPNQDVMNVGGENIGKVTSPIKMFEYMAAGRCIIASDLEVLKEILSGHTSYFADMSDAKVWKRLIDHIKDPKNRCEVIGKANAARQVAKWYTWSKRAENMVRLVRK